MRVGHNYDYGYRYKDPSLCVMKLFIWYNEISDGKRTGTSVKEETMKIAVTGKGGVGKTTIAASLCYAFAEKEYNVVAIDADPDANLSGALGFPEDATLTPIIEMKDLIEERTGAAPGDRPILCGSNTAPRFDSSGRAAPGLCCRRRNGGNKPG